jgi:hypothetical protein
MLPPYLPASRKIDRTTPVRSRRGKTEAKAAIAATKFELKQPLRVIGSRREAAIAAKRNKGPAYAER